VTLKAALQRHGFEVVRCVQETDRSAESGSMLVEAKPGACFSVRCPEESHHALVFGRQLKEMQKQLIERFYSWQKAGVGVAIYGGGVHTQGLLYCIGKSKVTNFIKVIFDDDPAKEGKNIYGIPVKLFLERNMHDVEVIVVSSLASEQLILEKLEEKGKKKGMKFVGVYRDLISLTIN